MDRLFLIVPAAGIGSRMAADRPKQYLRIDDRFLVDITLRRLLSHTSLQRALVALHPEDRFWLQTESHRDSRISACEGGEERADSVRNALACIAGQARDDDWVLVHDVARPCIRRSDLDRLIAELHNDPVGGILGAPVSDTVKRADADSRVAATVERRGLWRAFTPQMFRYGVLRRALDAAAEEGQSVTDEAGAVERLGMRPRLVAGHADNIKVTVPEDLATAAWILARIEDEEAGDVQDRSGV